MSLEPDVFASVNFSCYAEGWYIVVILCFSECNGSVEPMMIFSLIQPIFALALKKLEDITKENMEGSLIASVTPGRKLGVYHFIVELLGFHSGK